MMVEMNLLRRKAPPPPEPAVPGFGEWLLRQFANGESTAALPFATVERLCANAGSLLSGAAFARPEQFARPAPGPVYGEAALVAKRTADGFRASLADRQNTVLAWPWDHVATAAAWSATRAGDTSEHALGEAIEGVSVAYAFNHREQLGAVLNLWRDVAAGVRHTGGPADLEAMGGEMFDAYRAIYPAALSSPAG